MLIYVLWKLDLLKRDHQGTYRSDSKALFVSRLIFKFKLICGKTKKETKFCGD
jgi:hypothetical protein